MHKTIFTAFILLMAAQVYAAPIINPHLATPEEVDALSSRIASVFADLDEFPDASVSDVRLGKKLYWSGQGADAVLLAPVAVHFRGVTNSYCRLLTAKDGTGALALIKLPAQANFDDCRGIDQIRYLDLNGDGQLDVIEMVDVNSNAGSGVVSTALVYLSSPAHPGGYCYSAAASRRLAPADLKSDASVLKVLKTSGVPLGCGPQV